MGALNLNIEARKKLLSTKKVFLLDMDGTIYLGDQLIDGAKKFLQKLKETGRDILFLTNNASKNKDLYVKKLDKLGISVDREDIFTSGEATTIYLNSLKPGAKIFLLGTEALESEFEAAGFQLIKKRDDYIDFVVLSFDTTLTYEKLWIACDYLAEGVPFIATHPDINCPLPKGKYMPDAGAISAMIEASTGRMPTIIGKPSKVTIDSIVEKYGLQKDEIIMVGDRLYTDIKMGTISGVDTALVLSGEATISDHENSDIKASIVVDSVKDFINLIE